VYSLLTLVLVLHPQHKLNYFKTAQWEDGWIKTAELLVRTEFERSYLSLDDDSDFGCEGDIVGSNDHVQMVSVFHCLFFGRSY
jgi:hypothetical protein